MNKKKEQRRLMKLHEFILEHESHQKDGCFKGRDGWLNGRVWTLACRCKKTWVGENQSMGIELG